MRRYWDIYDRGREGFDLLERLLASTGPSEVPRLRAKALVTAADLAAHLDASVSARYAKAGGELALDLGDRATAALSAALIAAVNGLAGRYNEADGERALRLARQVGEPWLVCEGLLALGLSVDVRSRPAVERARAVLEEMLATAEESGDIYFIYAAHDNLCPYGFFYDDPGAVRLHVGRLGVLAEQFGVSRVWEDLRRGELLYAEGNYAGSLETHRSTFESARRRDFPSAWLTQQGVPLPVFLRSGKTRRPPPDCTASQPNNSGQQASGSATRVTGGLTQTWMCCGLVWATAWPACWQKALQ